MPAAGPPTRSRPAEPGCRNRTRPSCLPENQRATDTGGQQVDAVITRLRFVQPRDRHGRSRYCAADPVSVETERDTLWQLDSRNRLCGEVGRIDDHEVAAVAHRV